MVAEPWRILKMGHLVTSKNMKIHDKSQQQQPPPPLRKQTIGILSFEVANVMSKTIHLHKSLTDASISGLKREISQSDGVLSLVSPDEAHLLDLALAEKLDDLNRIAGVVSRLGKKCSVPALQGFEHVYGDVTSGKLDVNLLGLLVKDMERTVRKMERYVSATKRLYGEIEVMNELEQATRKFAANHHEESRKAFEQKLGWQRQDVRGLKDVSLWNQGYDKVVELLARAVCTIFARVCAVFGDSVLRKEFGCEGDSHSLRDECGRKSGQIDSNRKNRKSSYGLGPVLSKGANGCNRSGPVKREQKGMNISSSEVRLYRPGDFNLDCGAGPGRLFMECLSLSSSASKVDDDDDDEVVSRDDRSSQTSGCCSVASGMRRELPNHSGCFTPAQSGFLFGGEQWHAKGGVENGSRFGPKSRLPLYAPPSTVGGAALAMHYANVIIVIEKLLRYPHLVGEDARDDLYQMLPTSLRMLLKASLKTYAKDMAIYDAPLAHDWKERLDGILRWLAPLAHNMIRWQSERNFEQQQIVMRTNVLLLQTIYFADREKTEAAICELLVGLNYICRYEHQQNALLDCASSFDFDDCADWEMPY
ncbi:hypothetical protein RHSIM_Rhsim04G0188300 [Rhododendron simsii]|uniref:DUF668 domain-containing protein n=1 Tax=Rhododendron simsii TaxID=118357 RepID=A0A834H3E1_RHOSS|nr:hypothetical protein RHSIM_Rhsim04G0188300 [Rhododendron simsii]